MPFGDRLRAVIQLHEEDEMETQYKDLSGLDRRYSSELSAAIAALKPGEVIYWRGPSEWARSAPGIPYEKTEDGGLRPVQK